MPEFSSCISDMSIHVQSIYAEDTRKIFPSDCRNPRKIRMPNVQRKNTMTHQLGNNKGAHEQEAWSLNKRPTARAGHKNEGLAHNTDLQVHSRCQLAIAVPNGTNMEVFLHPSHRKIHVIIVTRQLSHVNCKNSERKLT